MGELAAKIFFEMKCYGRIQRKAGQSVQQLSAHQPSGNKVLKAQTRLYFSYTNVAQYTFYDNRVYNNDKYKERACCERNYSRS